MRKNLEDVRIIVQDSPSISELSLMLEKAFDDLDKDDQSVFDLEDNGQSLGEWFDIDELQKYLKHCCLLEARNKNGKLIGVALIGKQNPITWPDGNKVEMFVLAINSEDRKTGLGSLLVERAECEAKKMGAKKIILNTHIALSVAKKFYKKLGYFKIGVLKNYYANGDAVFYTKDLS